MSHFNSSSLQTSLFARSRSKSPRIRAELSPIARARIGEGPTAAATRVAQVETLFSGLWNPNRLDRLHEPLTRYHD